MRRKRKKSAASTLSGAGAAVLVLLAYETASAGTVDAAFKFEGLEITHDDRSLNIGSLSLAGPITRNNIDLVEFGTTLNLTNPLPVGVGDKFTLGWDTLAGTFTDPMTETSVTGNFDSLLTIVATGMISGNSETGPAFSPTSSSVTLIFDGAGMSGSFTTLSTLSPVPEMPIWSMLLAGFAGVGGMGFMRARKRPCVGA